MTSKQLTKLPYYNQRFEGVENELQELATTQGTNVERLVDLVSENEQILFLMRENLRQKVLQDVISIVVRTDRDNTQRIDKVEAKLLALKITVKLEVYGIFFDEEKFLMAVALNPTLAGVICTIRKLMPEVDENGNPCDDQSSKSDDSYFLDEDDMFDMFYMSRDEQRKRGSVMALRAAFHGQKAVSLARIGSNSLARMGSKVGNISRRTASRTSAFRYYPSFCSDTDDLSSR